MGLRTRLQLLILLPLIPALVLALFTNLEQRRFGVIRVENDAVRLVQLAAARQHALIDATRQHLEALARFPEARGTNVASYDGFFAAMRKVYSDYCDFGLIETNGDLVSCSLGRKGPTNLADRAHVQRVLKTKDFAIGEYQPEQGPAQASLSFGYPVFDPNGRMVRIVYAALDLKVLNNVAARVQLPKDGAIKILDRSGHILACYPDPNQWIGKFVSEPPTMATLISKGEGTGKMQGLDGVPRLFAFTSIRSGSEANLFVTVGIPTSLAFAETNRDLSRHLAILGVVALLAVLAASLYGNSYILRPVNALVSTTRRLASGELSARTGITRSSGELNQLACAFDEMAESLQRQRTQAENSARALRESESRLQLILDTALDAIITMDHLGTIQGWNPQAEKIFGWSEQEVMGQSFSGKVIAPAFRENHDRGLHRFVATGEGSVLNKRIEIAALHKNGHQFPVEVAITPIKAGPSVTFSAFVHDITERKRAEEKFRLAVEASPNAIVMVNQQGKIILVNAQTETLFGYIRQELIGQPIELLVPERFRSKHPGFRTDFHESPHARPMGAGMNLYGLCKDGREVPVEIALNPIHTLEGTLVLSAIVDITERKQAEAQITASLAEKEVLLKEIHHRVKNNLQFVSSLLSLQSNLVQDPRLLEILRESRDRIRTMALIHEKLYQSSDLAQIEFKRHILDLGSMVFRSYSPKSQAIKLDVQADAIFLAVETAVPLSFILNEIVSNCLKHAFPDGQEGTISIQFFQDGGDRFHLVVRDNGVGLPRDFALGETHSLGLRLVQILTDQIAGELTCRGNGGTEFEITFDQKSQNARS